jgi:hypothetical protein
MFPWRHVHRETVVNHLRGGVPRCGRRPVTMFRWPSFWWEQARDRLDAGRRRRGRRILRPFSPRSYARRICRRWDGLYVGPPSRLRLWFLPCRAVAAEEEVVLVTLPSGVPNYGTLPNQLIVPVFRAWVPSPMRSTKPVLTQMQESHEFVTRAATKKLMRSLFVSGMSLPATHFFGLAS